jgi:hypothetical protein
MPKARVADVTTSKDKKDGYLHFVARAEDTGKIVGETFIPIGENSVSASMSSLRAEVESKGYKLEVPSPGDPDF